jgi:hypothetical protein
MDKRRSVIGHAVPMSDHVSFSGPSEFSAINPDAMHNHGQPSSQCNDCLFHPAVPGDLRRSLSHDHFAERSSMTWAAS